LRFALLRGEDRLGVLARDFMGGPALHWGIEHFQGAAAGVDFVVMRAIWEAFEHTFGRFPSTPPGVA